MKEVKQQSGDCLHGTAEENADFTKYSKWSVKSNITNDAQLTRSLFLVLFCRFYRR
jgi:hypothetical protein